MLFYSIWRKQLYHLCFKPHFVALIDPGSCPLNRTLSVHNHIIAALVIASKRRGFPAFHRQRCPRHLRESGCGARSQFQHVHSIVQCLLFSCHRVDGCGIVISAILRITLRSLIVPSTMVANCVLPFLANTAALSHRNRLASGSKSRRLPPCMAMVSFRNITSLTFRICNVPEMATQQVTAMLVQVDLMI